LPVGHIMKKNMALIKF